MPGRRARSRAIGPWVDLHDLPPVPRNKKKKPKNRKRLHPSFRIPLALGLMPSKARQCDPLGLNLRVNDNMHIMEGDCGKSGGILTGERAPNLLARASKSDDCQSLLDVNIDVPEAAAVDKVEDVGEKENIDKEKEIQEPAPKDPPASKDPPAPEDPPALKEPQDSAIPLTNGEHSETQPEEEIDEPEKETSESEDNLRPEDDVEKEEEEEDRELEAMEAAEAESIHKDELAGKEESELIEEANSKEEDELEECVAGSPLPESLVPQVVVKVEPNALEGDSMPASPSELAMSLAKPASPSAGSKTGSRSGSPLSQPSSPKRLCTDLCSGKATSVSSKGETVTLWAKPPSPVVSPGCNSKSANAPAGETPLSTPVAIVKEESVSNDLDLRTNVSTISITTPSETLLRKRSVEKEAEGEVSSGSESDTGRKRVRVELDGGHTSPCPPAENQMAGNYMDYERERLIQDFVAECSQRPEELNRAVDKLQKELETLAELLKAKELEWNTLLRLKKLKEETLERLKRKKRLTNFDESSNDRFLDHATLRNALKPHGNNQLMMVPIVSSSPTSMLSRAPPPIRMPDYNAGQKMHQQRPILPKPYGNLVDPASIMREGRNGPVLDVKSLIADYSAPSRSRHPQDIPRRGRRVRSEQGPRSVAINPSSLISMSNMALGSGARVRTVADSPYMLPNAEQIMRAAAASEARGDGSAGYKDVLAQFAKLTGGPATPTNLSSGAGNNMTSSTKNAHPTTGPPPPPYPEVTLHPVGGSGRIPSPPVSTSLLHGILTKSTPSSRPSNFSPTLARLLTAPDRPTAAAHQSMAVHPPPPPYRPQQQSSSSRVATISDIINSSKKSRNEITITPVPGNQPTPKTPKEEVQIPDEDDGEGDRLVIDESVDDSPLQCQGCKQRSAQFVCAGCGNQWYCSRECQVTAWEEHSDVCSG